MPVNPTDSQSDASRLNGKQSHGPVTPEGKSKSSKNSLKLGLYAKSILRDGESKEEYDAHCAKIRSSFDCQSGFEDIEVQSLCNTTWQIIRCERLEASLSGDPSLQDIAAISQHRARLERVKKSQLNDLRSLLHQRDLNEKKELEEAAIIRRADRKLGRTTDLAIFGFVFSTQEVDKYIYYQDTLRVSKEALSGKIAPNRT